MLWYFSPMVVIHRSTSACPMSSKNRQENVGQLQMLTEFLGEYITLVRGLFHSHNHIIGGGGEGGGGGGKGGGVTKRYSFCWRDQQTQLTFELQHALFLKKKLSHDSHDFSCNYKYYTANSFVHV